MAINEEGINLIVQERARITKRYQEKRALYNDEIKRLAGLFRESFEARDYKVAREVFDQYYDAKIMLRDIKIEYIKELKHLSKRIESLGLKSGLETQIERIISSVKRYTARLNQQVIGCAIACSRK